MGRFSTVDRLKPVVALFSLCLAATLARAGPPRIDLQRGDSAGRLAVIIDGREAFVYQYAPTLDLPHYWPLNSPGGKNMLVEKTEPYPHHRSFWIADTVRFKGGREVSVYNGLYTGKKMDDGSYAPPFRDHVRHVKFTRLEAKGDRADIDAELLWKMDESMAVLRETRRLRVEALGGGEYFLDLVFVLTAAFGDVEFVSDEVHYAWPFLRLETRWSGDGGGHLISNAGAEGEEATNLVRYRLEEGGAVLGAEEVFRGPEQSYDNRWVFTRE